MMAASIELLKRLINECEPWQPCDTNYMRCYFCDVYKDLGSHGKPTHNKGCLFVAAQHIIEKADLLTQESFVVREDGKLYRRIPPRYNLTGE